jgi:hypothetical protein
MSKQEKIWIADLEEAKAKRKQPNLPAKPPGQHYFIMPKDIKVQNRLADEMIVWIENNEKVLDLDLFPLSKHLSPYRFYKEAVHNPYLDEALECCRYIISSRIQAGWFHKQLDSTACRELLPQYNKAYRDWVSMKILAAMESRNKQESSNFTVVLDPIQATSQVPERIEDERKIRDTDKIE